MRGRLVRRGVAGMVALAVGVVAAAGVVPTVAQADPIESTPVSVPGKAVTLAQAGELVQWGDNTYGQSTLPASLAGVAISQVEFPERAALVLTAAGQVVAWGSNPARLERVPEEVTAAKVVQLATRGEYAGVVTNDGRVLVWGRKKSFATSLDVPAGLSGVTQLALTEFSAAALKQDGTVVAWGFNDLGQTNVPAGLRATAIQATGSDTFVALTEDGAVVTWGRPPNAPLPAALQEPGAVKAIGAFNIGAMALLADGTTEIFALTLPSLPEEVEQRVAFTSREAALIASGTSSYQVAIVGHDGAIHTWDQSPLVGEIPAELNGRAVVQLVLAVGTEGGKLTRTGGVIITKMLRAEPPRVTGAVAVGSVLTGTPGTFSAEPDSVTSQWLVGGVPAGTGPQLAVTPAMVGKTISYQSTATKSGATAISSASDAVTVPAVVAPPLPPAPKVDSTTKVTKVTVAKKAKTVSVAGKVSASKSPAGTAKVTIKKGKKTIVTKSVRVSAAGALKLTVKKFGTLVAKKLKAKGKKAATAYRGKYLVTIAYAGNTQVKASVGRGKFTIKR